MNKRLSLYSLILLILLITTAAILIVAAYSLDISYTESVNYFHNFNELTILTHISTYIFGPSNISLRLPFILIYLLSVLLFYKISSKYIEKDRDILISTAIFMVLPGVVSASLLVNTSILVVFSVLLYVYLYNIKSKHSYLLLILFLFLDNSFAILFIALFFYSLKTRDNKLLITSLILFGISMQMYGFDSGGKPKGFFIETVAIYSSIFSPLVFFYFIYSIYRTSFKGELDLLWYISTTTLVFSILLSFRQSIPIEDFAPFVVIAIPIMVKTFLNSYRVRLPQFRIKHKIGVNIALAVLLINTTILIVNKPLYLVLDNPKKHFAYKHHIAQDIASKLKENGISSIRTTSKRLQERLKFYGISSINSKHTLYPYRVNTLDKEITIKYNNIDIFPLFINHINQI